VARRHGRRERDRGGEGRRPDRRRPELQADRGTHLRERLLSHSDVERPYTYNFEKTPFDVDNYCATIRVTPVTDGNESFVEWWTTFDCDRDQIGHWEGFFANEVFQGGFDALKAHFA
jgi:Polyketide cyclase / dehydrase and lipid transport